jgi:hypothetical protein
MKLDKCRDPTGTFIKAHPVLAIVKRTTSLSNSNKERDGIAHLMLKLEPVMMAFSLRPLNNQLNFSPQLIIATNMYLERDLFHSANPLTS